MPGEPEVTEHDAAFERGRAAARDEAERAADRRHMARLNGAIERIDDCMTEVVDGVRGLQGDRDRRMAVEAALLAAADKASKAGISSRQFWLGVAGLAAAYILPNL